MVFLEVIFNPSLIKDISFRFLDKEEDFCSGIVVGFMGCC